MRHILMSMLTIMAHTAYAQTFGTFTIRSEKRIEVEAGPIAAIDPGVYSIRSAHSGLSMGSQKYGNGELAAESKSIGRFELVPSDSGFLIKDSLSGQFLKERDDDYVQLSDSGTVWTIRSVPGSATVEICGVSGRVMEVDWQAYGSWVWMTDRTGSGNQEWTVEPFTGKPLSPVVATAARVRGPNGPAEVRTGREVPAPTISWEADGQGNYLYHVHAGGNIGSVRLNQYTEYDATTVSAPEGWEFLFRGWANHKQGATGGDFMMKSAWAPGPVLATAISSGPLHIEYKGHETARQSQNLGHAVLSQGSHAWVIGPAIKPGTDDAGLHALITGMVEDGLGFLTPLMDTSRSVAEELSEVDPVTAFERQAVESIRSYVGGGK